MSLRIIINNHEAHLPESSEIEIKLTNTFFNDREEDATYPLTLNLPANRHIFSFPDRFDSGEFEAEYPATIFFGPFRLLEGKCVITDVSPNQIEVFIATDNSTFWGSIKTQYLDDLDLGNETFSSPDAMMTAFNESTLGGKDYVVCPLYDDYMNKLYPLNINIDSDRYFYNPMLPSSSSDDKDKQASFFRHSFPHMAKHQCIYTPFVRLHKLIQKVFVALDYRIVRNDFDSDTMFNDVIVVCRRNGKSYTTGSPSFPYSDRVPSITVREFLQEIENKFGVQFIVNEAQKTISIISDISLGSVINIEATDMLQKHSIDEDDQKQDFIFKDKDNPDTFIQDHYNNERLIRSVGDQDDAESIECMSNIVGWSSPTEFYGAYRTNHMAVSATYAEDPAHTEYKKTIQSEFRLSIYRGFIKCNQESGHTYIPYPIASPEPLISSSQTNTMSLLWMDQSSPYDLFDKYHASRLEDVSRINREYEFVLKTSLNALNNFHNYFSSFLVIRNQKYRCHEISIKLSNKKIVEHIIKCYPA